MRIETNRTIPVFLRQGNGGVSVYFLLDIRSRFSYIDPNAKGASIIYNYQSKGAPFYEADHIAYGFSFVCCWNAVCWYSGGCERQ
jgi:hypothetical protein